MPRTGTGRAYGETEIVEEPPDRVIDVPSPGRVGDLAVPSGFPATAAGAVGQLVAIEVAAAESASVPGVASIARAWVAPGGPTAVSWTWRANVISLLETFGVPAVGSSRFQIQARPAMALVKDTRGLNVGTGWAVICLNLSLDLIIDGRTHQGVVTDCQRMIWDGHQWWIGPGQQPAQFVSQASPGTKAAYEAGFVDLVFAGQGPKVQS